MNKTERVFGLHAVRSLLTRNPARVSVLLTSENRSDARMVEILELAESAGVAVRSMTRHELDALVPGVSHQGVIAETGGVAGLSEGDLSDFLANLEGTPFLLVLDGVQDPHNLGACLRSADAAGVDLVIVPKDRSAPLSAVARKVACGGADHVPLLRVTNLARTLRSLKDEGIWLYGAASEAEKTLYETDLKGPLALILGGEGKGLRRLTREHCDGLASIPLDGSVSSLNVSVATGICLFEARRQRAD